MNSGLVRHYEIWIELVETLENEKIVLVWVEGVEGSLYIENSMFG